MIHVFDTNIEVIHCLKLNLARDIHMDIIIEKRDINKT